MGQRYILVDTHNLVRLPALTSVAAVAHAGLVQVRFGVAGDGEARPFDVVAQIGPDVARRLAHQLIDAAIDIEIQLAAEARG